MSLADDLIAEILPFDLQSDEREFGGFLDNFEYPGVVVRYVVTEIGDQLLLHKQLKKVALLVKLAKERFVEHPLIDDLEAKMYMAEGRYSDAIELLDISISKHDKDYLIALRNQVRSALGEAIVNKRDAP